MADFSRDTKKCRGCNALMHLADKHVFCLKCLTISHEGADCHHCKKIGYEVYSCRLGLVGDAITNSRIDGLMVGEQPY